MTPGVQRGADYDEKWRLLEAAGASIHGEADFVCRYRPESVLDAGCGTGRVAIELAQRGIDVVGVDLDPHMLRAARAKAPDATWIECDLVHVSLGRSFDAVVLPGNVMIFLEPGTEGDVVANLARHVAANGVLIAGFQLAETYGLDRYDADCEAAGLALAERYGTWDGAGFTPGGDYAVSVHRHR